MTKSEKLDKILIKGLLLRCVIGANKVERKEKQDVVINITLWCDLTKAAETDNIERAIDYRAINKKIIGLVEGSSFFLVETLADKIAQTCLAVVGVEQVKVAVEKPGALRFARSVGVELLRRRS